MLRLGPTRRSLGAGAQRSASEAGSPLPPHPLLAAQEVQEVLLDAGIAPNSNCASRAIGYRQAAEALQRWHADPASLTQQSMVGGRVGGCQALQVRPPHWLGALPWCRRDS